MGRPRRKRRATRKPRRSPRAARPRSTRKRRPAPPPPTRTQAQERAARRRARERARIAAARRSERAAKLAAKPKPKRPRPTGKVKPQVLPAYVEVYLVDEVVYRDRKGNVVPKGRRGARRSLYTWEVDAKTHQRLRMVSRVEPDFVEKIGPVPRDGIDMGRIDMALINSSATAAYPKAQLIEFTIKGRDQRGKTRRFKVSLDLGEVVRKRKLHRAVVGRVLQELRRRGFRTNYTLELFKQARLKGLKYRISWKEWRKLEPLEDMEIIVTMYR